MRLVMILFALALFPVTAHAQVWQMWVHHGGTITKFNVADIDSITYVFVDTIPPATPVLTATPGPGGGAITVTWTAVGDDGDSGTAATQELRVGTIGAAFEDMTPVAGLGPPESAGSAESFTVTDLGRNQTFCFRLRVTDAFGLSSTSDAACATTTTGPGDVVIAEVFGGAGAGGSTYNRDYVVLFNRTAAPVALQGYSLQIAPAGGATWNVTPFGGPVVAPHSYFLIALGPMSGGSPLPTPDFAGSGNVTTANGKVALLSTQNGTFTTCPNPAVVIDLVGYGSADCAEGATTPSLSSTTAAIRNVQGCQDTGNNAADFSVGSPTPRNSASPTVTCP